MSSKETGLFPVYSGLTGVKMDTKTESGYFVTYVSTSWKKEVSKAFMGKKKGMIIEFDKEYKVNKYIVNCCDVSWISKFPDECEILFARSVGLGTNNFCCTVVDESDGIQTISLKYRNFYR